MGGAMPPKKQFNRDMILKAAVEVVRERGMRALTARGVADKLKSSTAPVYSYFKSMGELRKSVVEHARDRLFHYATRPHTDRVFLNMGTGYALFARDEKELFRAMFLGRVTFTEIIDDLLDLLKDQLVKDPRFTHLPALEREALLEKMWIYTHGLATLICAGLSDDDSRESIVARLEEMGKIVITSVLAGER